VFSSLGPSLFILFMLYFLCFLVYFLLLFFDLSVLIRVLCGCCCVQRSIEDELDRESQGDVLTILVSYLVMFAYVSVMLGHYHSFTRILVSTLYTACLIHLLTSFIAYITV